MHSSPTLTTLCPPHFHPLTHPTRPRKSPSTKLFPDFLHFTFSPSYSPFVTPHSYRINALSISFHHPRHAFLVQIFHNLRFLFTLTSSAILAGVLISFRVLPYFLIHPTTPTTSHACLRTPTHTPHHGLPPFSPPLTLFTHPLSSTSLPIHSLYIHLFLLFIPKFTSDTPPLNFALRNFSLHFPTSRHSLISPIHSPCLQSLALFTSPTPP